MNQVTVIDYGMGNLLSVIRALEHVGASAELSSDPQKIESAERLLLPGVGAFGDGMSALCERGLDTAIQVAATAGTPLLGICLGAQMLFDSSEEFGQHQGLGLIPGAVCAIPKHDHQGTPLKVPHMGWADLQPANQAHFDVPLLSDTEVGSSVYFVHSYQAQPHDPSHRAAVCDYAGNPLTAMVHRDNIYGCQFHPEKSGPVGLTILHHFMEQQK